MEEIPIHIKVPICVDDINTEKVAKVIHKFGKHAQKLDLNMEELGTVISILQIHYFETFGAIPVSEHIADAIKKSPVFGLEK